MSGIDVLREVFRPLVALFLAELRDQAAAVGNPVHLATIPDFAVAPVVLNTRWELDYRSLLDEETISRVEESDEFEVAIDQLRVSPQLSSALFRDDVTGQPVPDWRQPLRLIDLTELFTARYANLEPDLTWSEDAFRQAFADLVEFVRADGFVSVLSVLPLRNFVCTSDTIALAPDLSISRLTIEEKQRIYRFYDQRTGAGATGMGNVDAHALAEITHAVKQRFDCPPMARGANIQVGRVISVLRMFKAGGVGGWRWFMYPSCPSFYHGLEKGHLFPLPVLDPLRRREPFELSSEEEEQLRQLFSSYGTIETSSSKNARLEFAINRFELGYERLGSADQLIDTWVALEGLFVEKDVHLELSHRASLRIARFLEDDLGARRELYRLVKRSYSARSKIVHGATEDRLGLRKVNQDTEEVLRRCLRRIVERGGSLDFDMIDFA